MLVRAWNGAQRGRVSEVSRGRVVAICLGGLCVLGLGVRLALPGLVRDALVDAASTATGRTASLEDLSLGLLAGRLELRGLALAGDEAAVLELADASLQLSWLGLLRGEVHLTSLTLAGVRLRLGSDEPFMRGDPEAVEEPAPESEASGEAAWPVLVERLQLRDFALEFGDAPRVTHLGLAGFDLASLRIDADGLTLGAIDLDRPVLQSSVAGEPPPPRAGDVAAEPFRFGAFFDDLPGIQVEGLRLHDGAVTFELAEGPVELAVDFDLDALELRRGGETRFSLRTKVAGGSVALEGRLVLDPLSCEATLRWSDIELARLQTVVTGLRLDEGSTSAELSVAVSVTESQGAEGLSAGVKGELAVLKARMQASSTTLLGWESLLVSIRDIRWSQTASNASDLVVALGALRLSGPNLEWSSSAADGEPDPAAAAEDPAEAMPIEVAVDLLQIVGGRVRVRDAGVTPPFEARARFQGSAEAIRWPQRDFERLSLSVTGEDGESLAMSGRLLGGEGEVSVDVESVGLARFDRYASTHGGVGIEAGRLSWRGGAVLAEASTLVKGKLVLDNLDLEDTRGTLDEFLGVGAIGIPFDAAVVILRDADGKIELPIEAHVGAEGTRVSAASIVANALQQAVLTSLSTPLSTMRLISDLAFDAGDVPLPRIAFAPGSSTPSEAAVERLETLVELLRGRDDVMALLVGRTSESEARFLAAEEAGSAASLARLGRQRAEAASEILVGRLGVDPDRVRIEAPEEGPPGLHLILRQR
jgi:hypothetical protein